MDEVVPLDVTWDAGTVPTPGQFLDWLYNNNQAQKAVIAENILQFSRESARCFTENHDGLKEQVLLLSRSVCELQKQLAEAKDKLKAWEETAELQKQIDAAAVSGGTVHVPVGTFDITGGGVKVQSGTTVKSEASVETKMRDHVRQKLSDAMAAEVDRQVLVGMSAPATDWYYPDGRKYDGPIFQKSGQSTDGSGRTVMPATKPSDVWATHAEDCGCVQQGVWTNSEAIHVDPARIKGNQISLSIERQVDGKYRVMGAQMVPVPAVPGDTVTIIGELGVE